MKESLPDKTIIEVFGIGNSQSRQEKTDCKITVDRLGIKEAGIGIYGGIKYIKYGDTYDKVQQPTKAYNIDYEVRIISTTARFDRILNGIVLNSLGNMYISHIENGTESADKFLLDFNGAVDITKDVFIERVFRYTAKDVYITEEEVLQRNVPQLIEIVANIIPVSRTSVFAQGIEPEVVGGEVTVIVDDDTDANRTRVDLLAEAVQDLEDYVKGEVPTGLINNQNSIFKSNFAFIPESLEVHLNGLKLKVVEDYQIVSAYEFTLNTSPTFEEDLSINYLKA